MTTPSPRGYPHKSAIADMEFVKVERRTHWSFNPNEHQRQVRQNQILQKHSKLASLFDALNL